MAKHSIELRLIILPQHGNPITNRNNLCEQRGDFLLQCLKLEIVGIENKALYSLRNVEIEILK